MPLGSLWLPGILSAVAVFVVSSIVHMALRYHRADYKKLSNEEPGAAALPPGPPAAGLLFTPQLHRQAQEEGPGQGQRVGGGAAHHDHHAPKRDARDGQAPPPVFPLPPLRELRPPLRRPPHPPPG